jgi:hypothetical protein
MTLEMRAGVRENIELTVLLADGSEAVAENMSATGIYLRLRPGTAVADWLSFQLDVPGAGLRFSASGEVVRRDAGSTMGVALKLHQLTLVPTDAVAPVLDCSN